MIKDQLITFFDNKNFQLALLKEKVVIIIHSITYNVMV